MLDFSLSELVMAIVVAIVVLKPEDLKNLIRKMHKVKRTINLQYQSYTTKLQKDLADILDEGGLGSDKAKKPLVRYVVDLEGNLQEAYDLSDIMPEIKNSSPQEPNDGKQ